MMVADTPALHMVFAISNLASVHSNAGIAARPLDANMHGWFGSHSTGGGAVRLTKSASPNRDASRVAAMCQLDDLCGLVAARGAAQRASVAMRINAVILDSAGGLGSEPQERILPT